MATQQVKRYTFADMRAHASKDDLWITVDGKVYDVTEFARRHPGGDIIYQGAAIDATILFETHHNMVRDHDKLRSVMKKYYIGDLESWKPVANFRTPFSSDLLDRVRAHVHKRVDSTWWIGGRWDMLSFGGITLNILMFLFSVYMIVIRGNLYFYHVLGGSMICGHVLGHAANHYSLFQSSFLNKAFSTICTNLWGLREQYWTFSHLLSHHCYNYADRDYMIEQHVPTRYFRTRPEEPWRPINAYQHILYRWAPAMAFFVGAMRWDCAPWVFLAPIAVPILTRVGFLRDGESSVAAPQFLASGSTHRLSDLSQHEDGVGMNKKFHVRESWAQAAWSLFLANIFFMPLFFYVGHTHGYVWAFLAQTYSFGFQSAQIVKHLLTQHLSEDIILKPTMEGEDDWYKMQIEASTSVEAMFVVRVMSYGINYQIEHHLFPCMCPQLLHEVAPIVREVCKEHGVQYNGFPSIAAAQESVYMRFKTLSVKPSDKSE